MSRYLSEYGQWHAEIREDWYPQPKPKRGWFGWLLAMVRW